MRTPWNWFVLINGVPYTACMVSSPSRITLVLHVHNSHICNFAITRQYLCANGGHRPRLVWPSLLIHVAPEFINIAASPIILHDPSYVSFSANSLSTIFQLVSFPSLRELVCSQTEAHPFTEPISFRSLQSLLTRSACTPDKLQIQGMHSLPGDLVQLLTHRSCNFLASLGVCHYVSRNGVPVNDEVLRTLALHHDNSACTHLKFLLLPGREARCSQSALLKMVESRIGSCATSQSQDGLLYLHIETNRKPLQGLDEVIKGSEMAYDSQSSHGFRLRRRRFRGCAPALHDFFRT